MTRFFFLFLISFLVFTYLIKADSSIIYNRDYANPVNVLSSFLWNEKKKGSIGLTSKISIKNRELGATIHPVLLDSSKIKTALSKIRYIDEEKQFTDFIFNEEYLKVLSKYTSKGLLLANKNQDIIFQFINKKKKNRKYNARNNFCPKRFLKFDFFFKYMNVVLRKLITEKNLKKKKKNFTKIILIFLL